MKRFICGLSAVIFAVLVGMSSVFAAVKANSIVGYWETINDRTKKPAGIMRIWYRNRRYYGKLVEIYKVKGANPKERCTKCRGRRHNKRVLGMTILRDMVYKRGYYTSGRILDARNGKEYRLRMKVIHNGKALQVRGYIGLPFLGRTYVWKRVRKP